jgi:5-amino-6-(5-phosphoribosylamino)uracil reductase
MSLDGKIASSARELPTFPSVEDRRRMDLIRATADAILIGGGTLRASDYPLRVRSPMLQQRRLARGMTQQPLNILLSASLKVPGRGRFFSAPDVPRLVVTTRLAAKNRRERLARSAEVLAWGGRRIALSRLMKELHERGIRTLLLEGGGNTNFEFFKQGLVDEIYLTLCPVIIGGKASPTPVDGKGFSPKEFLRYLPVRFDRVGGEFFFRYRRS